MERHFILAGHLVTIDFVDCPDEIALLPGFHPFWQREGVTDVQPAVQVRVLPQLPPEPVEKEMMEFESSGNFFNTILLKNGGYRFDISDPQHRLCATMQGNADFSHCEVRLAIDDKVLRAFGLNNCMMMAYAYATATQGTLLVHASVIRHEGHGYLMTAPSGTGKSTHTYLWYKNIPGCDLMNDDNPIIRVQDGVATVYGSPWSGKTPCYRNVQAPIGGIVRIKQMPQNQIRRLTAAEGMAVMIPSVSTMRWDPRVYGGVCDTIAQLVAATRLWELGCLPDAAAAHLCHNTIKA